ncbi:YniB family protein [Pragia fontium]|uniref:YniB-like protein n=2 Tax=Pragia fontium TaxID=82985 RepID=A0AAJ4W9F5_9GAMM|nr:YniB family protein [Pragia fontium]AKJ42087.1 hypothetical protein QQ39_08280 [Pragia fontium]SFC48238.1 YniB-like protein [Pragia fontium DSM 5563 = ATCC 49100]SUB82324.1 Uncharacterised protein [Pragia fontium]VEJ55172.1 Uncharacterised protein [Pragia fontium]GKX61880.1 yfeABCD regulator yfeE [Pragia fontium]
MTHHQASAVALLKRIAGIVIFIPALISTVISVLKYLIEPKTNMQEMTATIMDFLQVIIKMVRQYTSFFESFWVSSPVPDISNWSSSNSLWFMVIFLLMFVGLALSASGIRLFKRIHNVREGVTERAILEAMNGDQARSREELQKLISIPNTSIFAQFGLLYVAPVFWGIFIYIILYFINLL